jgi:hypothetical protein
VSKADALPLTRLAGGAGAVAGARGSRGGGQVDAGGAVDAAARALAEFDAVASAAACDAARDSGGGGGSADMHPAPPGSSLVTLLLASPECIGSRWRVLLDLDHVARDVCCSRCLGVCEWSTAVALEVDRSATWGEVWRRQCCL